MLIRKLDDTMSDIEVESFFKRATGREYNSKETCVNDLRRICMLFWNEEMLKRIKTIKENRDGNKRYSYTDVK